MKPLKVMPIMCKSIIKVNAAYFNESKILYETFFFFLLYNVEMIIRGTIVEPRQYHLWSQQDAPLFFPVLPLGRFIQCDLNKSHNSTKSRSRASLRFLRANQQLLTDQEFCLMVFLSTCKKDHINNYDWYLEGNVVIRTVHQFWRASFSLWHRLV